MTANPAITAAIEAIGVPVVTDHDTDPPNELGWCDKHQRSYSWKFGLVRSGQSVFPSMCPDCLSEQREAAERKDARERVEAKRAAEQRRRQIEMETRIDRAAIPLRYREHQLATFPVERAGGNAAAVVEGCRSYLNRWEQVRKRGTNLILLGAPGRGKTGLACAIANRVISDHFATALFITAYGAVRHQRDTWGRRGKREGEALADLTTPDLLVMDDVGAQVGGEGEMLLLFEVLNTRYSERRPTIVLSNLPLGATTGLRAYLGNRLCSRLLDDDAMVLGCNWGDLRGQA